MSQRGLCQFSLDFLENRCIFVNKMKKLLIPVLLVALLGCATRQQNESGDVSLRNYFRDSKPKDDADVWHDKGAALFLLGQYEESLEAIEKAIELKQDFIAAWEKKGYALRMLGRKEEENKAFEKAEELRSQKKEARKKAEELKSQGEEGVIELGSSV